MGLYLCVFANTGDDEELEGVDVGSYEDIGRLRRTVSERLEPAGWGTRFPVLMGHSDSDGQWNADEAVRLGAELLTISAELARLPAVPLPSGWPSEVARAFGISPVSLLDCFFDIDGEPLLDRLVELARGASQEDLPIWFQ